MKKHIISELARVIAGLPRNDQKKFFAKLAKFYGKQSGKSKAAGVMLKVSQHNCHSLEDVMRHLGRLEPDTGKSKEG